jgi:hypothetical protein
VRLAGKFVTAVPRILGAIAILLFGPVVGALIGLILAILALPQGPSVVANSGHAAAGDGFLIIMYVAISLVISIPMSIFGAGLLLFDRENGSI